MPAGNPLPHTLGELRSSHYANLAHRSIKDEMRDEPDCAAEDAARPIFPGIVGYEDTVVPQIVNAVLSRQNFILLGLRGQAKSRILRALTALLDEQMPYVAGCEIRDNPYLPLCRRCRELMRERGDATPIAYLTPRGALCGEAGDSRCDGGRFDWRSRSDQGGARRREPCQRADDALWVAAARQSRNLCDQRAARSGGQNPSRAVQHHAGRRCAD